MVDADKEKKRLTSEIQYIEGYIAQVEKKLSNERLVANSPVVEKERKKLADGGERLRIIEESLNGLM